MKRKEIVGLINAWNEYKEFLKEKYPANEDEEWQFTCPYHQNIDRILSIHKNEHEPTEPTMSQPIGKEQEDRCTCSKCTGLPDFEDYYKEQEGNAEEWLNEEGYAVHSWVIYNAHDEPVNLFNLMEQYAASHIAEWEKPKMSAEEFFTEKAVSVGYEDLVHYFDCRHEEDMAREYVEWAEQYAVFRTIKGDSRKQVIVKNYSTFDPSKPSHENPR